MNSGHKAPEHDGSSGSFGTWVELIKATAWPAAALVIFFFIKGPLVLTLSEVPSLIRSAQNVTVGSMSISLRSAGIQPDVRKGLSKVSKSGLILLLNTGATTFGYKSADWEKDDDAAALKELQADGLISITPSSPGEAYPLRYSLTPGARNAYEVLIAYIMAQLAEAPAPERK